MTISLDRGEPIVEATGGGAIAGHVHNVDVGSEVRTVVLDRDVFLSVASDRLPDDYEDVWVWCDGDHVAITDHERPGAADANGLDELDGRASRVKAIEPTDDAQRTLVDRETLLEALAELDSERVRVHVLDDQPVIVEADGDGVAIAPKVKPEVANGD